MSISSTEPIKRWRRYLAECIGTFCLVFAGTGAVVIDGVTGGGVTHVGIAMTFGLVVMAMIYAIGDVSGAHLNPAVTLGFCVARRFELRCAIPYIISQLIGAFIASGVLLYLFGNVFHLGATLPAIAPAKAFVMEAILTGILMFVILHVSTGPKEKGTMAGIAVGGVIMLEAMFAGPVTGASMNPARSIAPAVVSGELRDLWLYVLAPIVGAVGAVPIWAMVRRG